MTSDPLIVAQVAGRARGRSATALGLAALSLGAAWTKVFFPIVPTLMFAALTITPLLVSLVAILGALLAVKSVVLPIPDAADLSPSDKLVPIALGGLATVIALLCIALCGLELVMAQLVTALPPGSVGSP